jgi:hypothetical protein
MPATGFAATWTKNSDAEKKSRLAPLSIQDYGSVIITPFVNTM